MTLDFNNERLLRQGEVAFVGAFHGIEPSDIELATAFGHGLVRAATEVSIKPRYKTRVASILSEVALLASQQDDEELMTRANTAAIQLAATKADNPADLSSSEASPVDLLRTAEAVVVSKKAHVIRGITERLAPIPRVLEPHNEAAEKARKLCTKLLKDSKNESGRRRHAGRRNELLTVALFNIASSGMYFFHTSELLNGPQLLFHHVEVDEQEHRFAHYSVAVDSVGVQPKQLKRAPLLLQIKRNSEFGLSNTDDPYAPHIVPVVWSDHLEKLELSRAETGKLLITRNRYAGSINTMLRDVADRFMSLDMQQRKGVLLPTNQSSVVRRLL